MAKQKSVWCCNECGHTQLSWSGQCAACLRWNVLSEEVEVKTQDSKFQSINSQNQKPVRLDQVRLESEVRMLSKQNALDRLLGGGLVKGSLTLIGGDPGIGKSTLLLQATASYSNNDFKVLYVCAEESVQQISLRAKRLKVDANNLLLYSQSDFTQIKAQIEKLQPDIVIVDSIQVVYKNELPSLPGSVAQIREVTTELMYLAKSLEISIFIIGHVTKSGDIAGPKVLEHLVDSVFYFEGDKQHHYRILRAIKNRFGPTDEIAIYQMQPLGLKEVVNPSEIFLEERKKEAHGCAVVPIVEGSCPILVEAGALVTSLAYAAPTRKSMGIDPNRLALLLAVLEKKVGYNLTRNDVFVALAGGLRATETALDLGIILAITSSFLEKPVPLDTVVMGEVGLSGNVRRISKCDKRLKEAYRMGYKSALVPKGNLKDLPKELKEQMNVHPVEYVGDALEYCFNS